MKKILTMFVVLLAFTASAFAQYQVENSDFEEWDDTPEPLNWNSFGTVTGTWASFAGSSEQLEQSSEVRDGSSGASSALITAAAVKLGSITVAIAQGNLTTGQINAGSMTATDASGNYNFTNLDDDDYNAPFTGLPDSLNVWVKYRGASSSHPYGKVSALLHADGYFQDPWYSQNSIVDLVAYATDSMTTTLDSSTGDTVWTQMSIPFVYGSGYDGSSFASAWDDTTRPAYALVTFATNTYAGGSDNTDYMYVDDMEFIYNSELSRFVYNYSSSACYEYEIGDDGVIAVAPTITDSGCTTASSTSSYALYNDGYKSAVQYETAQARSAGGIMLYSNGVGASIDTVYDAFSGVLTITVKGDNYSEDSTNYHTYTAQFRPKISKTSTNKGLYAQVTENGTVTSLDTTTVRRLTYSYDASRSIRFTNLTIGGTTDSLSLRDLVTTETDDGKSFSATGTVEIGDSSYEYVLSGDSVASDTLASSYAIELEGLGVSIKVGYAYSVEAFVEGVYSGSSLVFYGDTVTLSSNDVQVLADGTQLSLTDNGDGTYSFVMPGSDVAITATTVAQASFHDYLLVALETDEIGYAEPDTITVYLDSLSDGTYNFALYNFTFGGTLSLGNILLYGITPEVGDGYVSFSTTDTLDIVGTPAEIQLTGKVVGEKLYFYIYIPNFSNAYNVHVYFGTYKVAVADEASELVSFSTRNGTDSANYTDTVTITVADGVSLYSVSVSTESGEEVDLAEADEGYYFIMPSEDVTITATALTATVAYTDYMSVGGAASDSATVYLYTLSDGTYVLKIQDFTYGSMSLGDIELAGLTLSGSELSGSGSVSISLYGSEMALPFELSGTVESESKLYLALSITFSGSEIAVAFGSYTVTNSASDYVTVDRTAAVAGETVTITVADGVSLYSVSVSTESGEEVEFAETDEGYTFTMPAEDVTVTATALTATVAYTDYMSVGGAASDSATVYLYTLSDGTYVLKIQDFTYGSMSLGDIELAGLALSGSELSGSGSVSISLYGSEMSLPFELSGTVESESKLYLALSITFSGSETAVAFGSYTVTNSASDYVTVDRTAAVAGETVTITVADGVSLYGVSVSTESGEEVEFAEADEGYTFTMPSEDVTVTATTITETATYEDYLLVSGGSPEAKSVELYTLSDGTYVLKISDLSLSLGGATIDVGDVEVALSGTTSALSGSGTVLSAYSYTLEGSVESGKLHFTMVVMGSINVYFGTYSITLVDESSLVGSVTSNVASDSTVQGDTVTITPADGAEIACLLVKTASGTITELEPGDDGTYTFTMPGENVTIEASAEAATLASYSFHDYLLVALETNEIGYADPDTITVYLDSLSDGTYNFALYNFTFGSGSDALSIGDIVLDGITPEAGDGYVSFTTTDTLTLNVLGTEIPAEIQLTGKVVGEKLYFYIYIPDFAGSYNVHVYFGTYAITVADEASELVSFSTRNGTDSANYTDTVYVTLADGVEADSVAITAGTETVTLVASDDGYYFIMPEASVTITVTGSEEEDSSSSEDSSDSSESESSDSSSDSSDSSSDSETAIAYVKAASSKLYADGRSIVVVSSSARQAKVYSLTGKLIASKELVKGETRIGSLPNGVYMVRLSDGTKGKVKITSR